MARSLVALAALTTLRLGGCARELVEVRSEEELREAVRAATGRDLLVLGGGSNLVVGDAGFAGTVLRMMSRGVAVHFREGRVLLDVAAGEPWDAFVERSVDETWGGIECLAGIPGLAGATPIQNVGAYGQQVSDTLESVRVYDRTTGVFVDLSAAECAFSYRSSLFKRVAGRYIVTSVRFALRRDGADTRVAYAELASTLGVTVGGVAPQRRVFEAILRLRASKGMLLSPDDPESVSAGSFFMNPTVTIREADEAEERGRSACVIRSGEKMPRHPAPNDAVKLSAAWLIERSGFARGTSFGCFRISRKHSLALVHGGGGTTQELLSIARHVRDGVRDRFGVTLVPEPVIVGASWEE